MPKKKKLTLPNPFRKDFCVVIQYDRDESVYFCKQMTKLEIINLLINDRCMGEGVTSIFFREATIYESGLVYCTTFHERT